MSQDPNTLYLKVMKLKAGGFRAMVTDQNGIRVSADDEDIYREKPAGIGSAVGRSVKEWGEKLVPPGVVKDGKPIPNKPKP